MVANEEGTKNWFIRKVDTNSGFEIRVVANSVGFRNRTFNEAIARNLKLEGTVGFLIGKNPVTIDNEKYFQLITTRPVSYTHLDVYKRQDVHHTQQPECRTAGRL